MQFLKPICVGISALTCYCYRREYVAQNRRTILAFSRCPFLAMSVLVIWSRDIRSRDVSPCYLVSRCHLAMSCLAFSAPPKVNQSQKYFGFSGKATSD